MSNDYSQPYVKKPSGGKNKGAGSPAKDTTGTDFANAVKNNPLIQTAQGIADAPLAMRNVANKVGKKVGKFGKALGL